MAEDIGLLLRGIGAAVTNQVPQFREQMAQESERKYIQGQREQQAQMQRAELTQARQQAMYKDAESALKLLASGNLDGVVRLGRERIELLKNFPGADPSDTVRITQLAQLSRAGDRGAYQALQRELLGAVQTGMAMGYIVPPQVEEKVYRPGDVVFRGGQQAFAIPEQQKAAEVPAALQTLQARAKAAGLREGTPEYQEFFRTGGTQGGFNINVPPATPPSGYMNEYDERGNFIGVKPTPGGPVDIARRQAQQTQQRYSDVVLEDIGRYKALVSGESAFEPITGFTGAQVAKIPGTQAFDASQLADTISAGIAFDRLQSMREASPTGGALGAVTEREMDLLKSSLGSISQSQGQEQLLENLNRLERIYSDIMTKFSAYPSARGMPSDSNPDPLGIL